MTKPKKPARPLSPSTSTSSSSPSSAPPLSPGHTDPLFSTPPSAHEADADGAESSGSTSDWSSPSDSEHSDHDQDHNRDHDDLAEHDGFDLVASRDFSSAASAASVSSASDAGGDDGEGRMRLSFPDPMMSSIASLSAESAQSGTSGTSEGASSSGREELHDEQHDSASEAGSQDEDGEYSMLLDAPTPAARADGLNPFAPSGSAPVVEFDELDSTPSTPPPEPVSLPCSTARRVSASHAASASGKVDAWVRQTSSARASPAASTMLRSSVLSGGESMASSQATVVPSSSTAAVLPPPYSVGDKVELVTGEKQQEQEQEKEDEKPVPTGSSLAEPASHDPLTTSASPSAVPILQTFLALPPLVKLALVALLALVGTASVRTGKRIGSRSVSRDAATAAVPVRGAGPTFSPLPVPPGRSRARPVALETTARAGSGEEPSKDWMEDLVKPVEGQRQKGASPDGGTPDEAAAPVWGTQGDAQVVFRAQPESAEQAPALSAALAVVDVDKSKELATVPLAALPIGKPVEPVQPVAEPEAGEKQREPSLFGAASSFDDSLPAEQQYHLRGGDLARKVRHAQRLAHSRLHSNSKHERHVVHLSTSSDDIEEGKKRFFAAKDRFFAGFDAAKRETRKVLERAQKGAERAVEEAQRSAKRWTEAAQTPLPRRADPLKLKRKDDASRPALGDISALFDHLHTLASSSLSDSSALLSRRLSRRAAALSSRLAHAGPVLSSLSSAAGTEVSRLDRRQRAALRSAHKAAQRLARALRDETARAAAGGQAEVKDGLEAAQAALQALSGRLREALDPALVGAREKAREATTKAERHLVRAARTARWWQRVGLRRGVREAGEKRRRRDGQRRERRERRERTQEKGLGGK